ncbi:Bicupin, oxalate decarboxylase/oxidase [Dendrothele bispora CBS 962.96]|uniref:Bicupin, oxalate decarboxylase/oxidase n=1 Tax=Dendrothele bispora (strain CBS 962.96) TaxID=1314807 RepID=A0A4S8MM84_DENBC|nr:Bicupin, oxalate decarboxylase/oxidase [Dendrothele bispora CBS 962.96]
MIQLPRLLCSLLLAKLVASAPASSSFTTTVEQRPSSTFSGIDATATVPFASTDPNQALWGPNSDVSAPAPERNGLGASIVGPSNPELELENADLLAPPTTDSGTVMNAKWPFTLSHNRLQTGGWARQQNVDQMPIATSMAGVDMRLEAGAIRELHWHKTSEWAYVLKGTTQVTAVDANGRNFVGNAGPGDLWFFPAGVPHSLQATADDPDGSEFLLASIYSHGTFLLTDWLAHVPFEVILKNFQATDPEAFSHIPAQQLYIFPSVPPTSDTPPEDPQGQVPQSFVFPLSQMNATQLAGGSIRMADSTVFPVSTTISVAEVTVNPGGMSTTVQWHPTMDEWSFFLQVPFLTEGEGRMTIFAAESNAATFDYQAGDIGFVPATMGHYVENTGNTTLRYLEIFNGDRWLALTPPELVKAHLNLDDETIAKLPKTKPIVV